jgi:hypothetical protein
MKKFTTLLVVAVVTSASAMAALSGSASAGGLIGDLIEGACGGCGVGRALDDAHRQLGNPLDQAGAAAAQSYGVPVSPHCATSGGIVADWSHLQRERDARRYSALVVEKEKMVTAICSGQPGRCIYGWIARRRWPGRLGA